MESRNRDWQGRPITTAADAFAAFVALRDSGEAPSFEAWISRFPQFEDELWRMRAESDSIQHGAGAAAGTTSAPTTLFHRGVRQTSEDPDSSGPLPDLVPDRVIGDFRLVRRIAQGGMGQVWEAVQTSLRRSVAMKFIRPDRITDQAVAFFAREGRAGGRLNHSGVVTVYAVGESEGVRWIAQELVAGGCTMRDFIEDMREAPAVPADYDLRLARFFVELAEAMQFAHDAGVIHRDLKPQNILVTPDDRPKVSDFGLARLVDEASISAAFALEGTPHYMSPEQVSAKVVGIDHRTDVFSLGTLLYEALTLSRPFEGETEAKLYERILLEDPADPRSVRPQIPDDLAVICLKALEKRRQDRYASMRELGDDLRRFLDDEPILARRPRPWQRARKWGRRHPAAGTAVGLGLLLLVGGGWAAYSVWSVGREALRQEKENLVIQARHAIEDAHLTEAERLMDEYRALDAGDFLPDLLLARGYSQYLRAAEAEEHFEAARRMGFEVSEPDPDDAEGLYLHGLALVIERNPARLQEAIESLSEAIRLDPLIRGAYFPLYQLHKETGDPSAAEQALAAFQQILATGDDYYDVVEAMRAELQGRFKDAVDIMLAVEASVGAERAAELRVDRVLGRLYLHGGDLDAAEVRLQAAVAAIPTDAGSWANLGMLGIRRYWSSRAAEHLDLALEYGRRAAEEYPKLAPAHRVVLNALVFQATQRFDPKSPELELFVQAEKAAAALRALDPEHPSLDLMEAQIDFYLGMAAEAQDDFTEAEERYRASLARDPNQVLPRIWLGSREYEREDYEAAFDQFSAAREVLFRHAQEAAVRQLPSVVRTQVHIWTLGTAGRVGTPEAIEIGLAAREDVEAAIEAELPFTLIELLNYVAFLATSPAAELRDCDEAAWVFVELELEERLRGTPHEGSLAEIEAAIRDCR